MNSSPPTNALGMGIREKLIFLLFRFLYNLSKWVSVRSTSMISFLGVLTVSGCCWAQARLEKRKKMAVMRNKNLGIISEFS
jgi:hypothetical protein